MSPHTPAPLICTLADAERALQAVRAWLKTQPPPVHHAWLWAWCQELAGTRREPATRGLCPLCYAQQATRAIIR